MIDAPESKTLSATTASPDPAQPPAHVEPKSALLDMLPHVLRTLKREPALAISLMYLLVAMAGIFYNFSFYREFGVPVLTLSQISDFLVAGIQQPMALVLVLTTFPLCWLFDWFNLRGRRRRAREAARLRTLPQLSMIQRVRLRLIAGVDQHVWYRQAVYVLLIVVYGWMFVGAYADRRSEAVKRGEAAQVRVWTTDGRSVLTADKSEKWTYLGAIAAYVFLYDIKEKRAEILPVNAIARIEPLARAGDASSNTVVAPIP